MSTDTTTAAGAGGISGDVRHETTADGTPYRNAFNSAARDGQRCPGCRKANQAEPCVFCGQLQDPGCGHGTEYGPRDEDGPGRWRCCGCGAVTAEEPGIPHLVPAGVST